MKQLLFSILSGTLFFIYSFNTIAKTQDLTKDSIRTEQKNGKSFILHKVTVGETLRQIAKKYKTTIRQIIPYNANLDSNFVKIGQIIYVLTSSENKSKAIITESMVSKMLASVNPKKVVHEIGKGERITTNSTSSFVLHRTFPVGSMVFLVNPTNRIATQAKVIGKIPNIDSNKEIIIKISEAACKELFIVNDKFAIEVVYEKIEK